MSKPLKTQTGPPPIPGGFLYQGQKRFAPGSMPVFPPTTRRRCPCSWLAMRDYAAKRIWTVAIEVQDVGPEPRHAPSGRCSSKRPAGERSIASWSGDWIAGDGRWWTW